MSKIAVVYWSGTGNTEAMANAVLEGVKEALETMQPEVNLDEEMRQKAALPLEKMLKLAAQ